MKFARGQKSHLLLLQPDPKWTQIASHWPRMPLLHFRKNFLKKRSSKRKVWLTIFYESRWLPLFGFERENSDIFVPNIYIWQRLCFQRMQSLIKRYTETYTVELTRNKCKRPIFKHSAYRSSFKQRIDVTFPPISKMTLFGIKVEAKCHSESFSQGVFLAVHQMSK